MLIKRYKSTCPANGKTPIGIHPETPDEKQQVSNSESGDFLSWQGNQGIARRHTTVRRTSKTAD
jgi:hypothetical protein